MPRTTQKPLKNDLPRPYAEIGQRIKDARTSRGLNQTDVVADGAATLTVLRLVESGRRAPSVELLKYVHDTLGADLNFIITGKKG